jgi:hypothetical protein
LDLSDQQAEALVNLAWLFYQTNQVDGIDGVLGRMFSVIPTGYRFPLEGTMPPMAHEERKAHACLSYWSILGRAELLSAYVALDRAQSASPQPEQASRLQQATRAITLSLAYQELIADAHFDMTRAESSLHQRILRDGLSIAGLHQQAQQVAAELGMSSPTRFQRFLDRMFGPAGLWV